MAEKLKLMVVDDERDNLDLLYRTFRREFKVFRADGAFRALEILEAEGEMAIIISDQSMPEMSGLQLLGKTSETFPDTVRILLTGYSEDALDGAADNIFKCISKPWHPEELKAVMQEAAQRYKSAKGA